MEKKKIDSRASQTKVKEQKKVWTPPSSLDAPPAPDGFKHRWIRAESMGFDDTSNMSAKLRSGFELVRADEYPEQNWPTESEGKYAGIIGQGGLVLARIAEEIALQIDEYYKKQNEAREEAVETNLMKEQHPSMRTMENNSRTRVTFGGTKKS